MIKFSKEKVLLLHQIMAEATGGSVGMDVKDRLKLIPYESLVGLVLTICTVAAYLIL